MSTNLCCTDGSTPQYSSSALVCRDLRLVLGRADRATAPRVRLELDALAVSVGGFEEDESDVVFEAHQRHLPIVGRAHDRRDCGAWPVGANAGPLLAIDLREASSGQSLGEFVNGPSIGRHDLVVEGGHLVAVEEADHQRASWSHHSVELGEYTVQLLGRHVDQREPSQNTGDGMILDAQAIHRPEVVHPVRIGSFRMGNELGNHVDPPRIDTHRPKVAGDMAGSAAHVEHGARPNRQMLSDEGEVVGMYLPTRAEQLDVKVCHGGVRVSNLLHIHRVTIRAFTIRRWMARASKIF